MPEQITNPTVTEPATTPVQAAQTQPAAVNVDINSILEQAQTKAEAAAEIKMVGVFKSMLEQHGLDAEAIKNMTAEFKAKQVTPEQTIQALNDDLAAERSKIAAFEQEKVLHKNGVTDAEDVALYRIRINQLVTEDKTFAQAATEYFTAHPRSGKVPATVMFDGKGQVPVVAGTTKEDYAKMSYADRLKLKAENPTLYEQLKG